MSAFLPRAGCCGAALAGSVERGQKEKGPLGSEAKRLAACSRQLGVCASGRRESSCGCGAVGRLVWEHTVSILLCGRGLQGAARGEQIAQVGRRLRAW